MKTNIVKTKDNSLLKRVFDDKSIADFLYHLREVDHWSPLHRMIESEGDASRAYDFFINIYSTAFEFYLPLRTHSVSSRMTPRHLWMTKGLMKSFVKKSKLYKKFVNNSIVHKEQYIAYRNKLKILLQFAEEKYYSDKFSKFKGNIHQT